MVHVYATDDMKTMNDELKLTKDDAAKTRGKLLICMKVDDRQTVLFAKQRKLINIECLHIDVIDQCVYDTL